jgi:hypothetical protein
MRMTRARQAGIGAGILAFLLCGLAGTAALAQGSGIGGVGAMKVPGGGSKGGADGVNLGRSVLHAGASLEIGWDSNVFYQDSGSTSSAIFRLSPSLSIGTRPAPAGQKSAAFVYNVGFGLDYTAYLQDIGTSAAKRHQIGANLGVSLTYDPSRLVAFSFTESFARTNEPRPGQDGSIDRDYNTIGFDVKFVPGRGPLTFLLGYRFNVDVFEQEAYGAFNRLGHAFTFKADWRFFPQTSFWFQASTGYTDFLRDASATNGKQDLVPFRALVGLTGRFTKRLTVDAGIGYGGGYMMGGDATMYHNAVAHAGLTVAFTPTINGGLGYRHDFSDSLIGDIFQTDSAYIKVDMAFFSRLIVSASFSWTLANYQGMEADGMTGSSCDATGCTRKDNWLQVAVGVDYYFLKWLSLGASYDLFGNISDFDASFLGVAVQPGFIKHRVLGRVVLYY